MLSKIAVCCASWMMLTSGLTALADSSIAPDLITRRVQKELAARLNVSFHTLEITEAKRETWPDSCLGLARAEEQCQSGDVRGWQIEVMSAQQIWRYRSDRAATRLRMEPISRENNSAISSSENDFSTDISQKLLETVSQHAQEPVSALQVLGVQPAVWDGCMGITKPEIACTQATIEGFRVIVGDERFDRALDSREAWEAHYARWENSDFEREWVYHISADGDRIIHNDSATNLNYGASTYFMSIDRQHLPEMLPEMRDDAVFQIVYDSNFGFTNVTTLAADGNIFFEKIARSPGEEDISEKALVQMSLIELSEFEQLLAEQQFSNLNGIMFSNDDPELSTEGNVYLRTADTTVSLSAAEEALPPQLQTIIKALDQFPL